MDVLLSVLMLAAFALAIGAIAVRKRGGSVRQMWLMLIAAAVMLANVLILAVPVGDSPAPAERIR